MFAFCSAPIKSVLPWGLGVDCFHPRPKSRGFSLGIGNEAGKTLQLIVGQERGEAAETVAILPDTAEGEVDAETMAHAILRTLAIVKEAFVGSVGPVLGG